MEIRSFYPPGLVTTIDNKTYIVAGNWAEVPNGTKLSDVKWIKVLPKSSKTEHIIVGTKGKNYKVINNSGVWRCSCPAFGFSGFKRTCKHIQAAKSF
jgi:hypothetical protein